MLTLPTRVQSWLARPPRLRPPPAEPPLRAELFSVEQLARHARALAAGHKVATRRGANRLIARLAENEAVLRAFNRVSLVVGQGRRITPAAEWLLDNSYLIEEQIQLARRHLPRGYSRELPRLLEGPSTGFPRVYDIVLQLIAHVDAQIDAQPLAAFVSAYQSAVGLKLGELWAIPIMLRLGLIENLQRVTTRLMLAREDRNLANLWVARLREVAEKAPSQLVVVVADMARSELSASSSFVAEFCQCLSRQSPVLHLARTWLEQRLAEQGSCIDQMVQLESQNQAADQVSVSHSIASLRFLSGMDWKDFVEGLSLVEAELRRDPAEVYATMDFPTRNLYRHSVEFFARHSGVAEEEVAREVVRLTGGGRAEPRSDARNAHIGFYLVDKGRVELGRRLKVRWPWRSLVERCIHHFPLTFYAGGILGLSVLATYAFVSSAAALGVGEWRLVSFTTAYFLAVSQLAVGLMNCLAAVLVKPRLLPRLDYSSGIPASSRTMVIVPTMLTTLASVDHLLETLEVHHLSNRDPHLHFGLLTDFRDAARETQPDDDALVRRARAGVEQLNLKYGADGGGLFFLFHRPRRWNPSEGLWMGYERKRGKLTELNALLRGGAVGCFSEIVGVVSLLPSIKYVITLDTDTQLPRDAARLLAGTMAHPLNRPRFDARRRVVEEGYSILQPRVSVSLPSARRSWFVRLLAGDVGIDPYTREVSDVYQDVFHEGSFIGKGIYDVDAFAKAMDGRFPENTVLSHDLLEACHARSALVTDVEFYEEHPSRYAVDVDRRRRWIRGDWQIAQWLLPRVPGSGAGRVANPLSPLSQWKIFDNLRRSLAPMALTLLLLGGWLLAPALGGVIPLLVLSITGLPALLAIVVNCGRKARDVPWGIHWRGVLGSAARQAGQTALTLAFLPYDAFISFEAVGITVVRVLVTRRGLLEWRTSSDSESAAPRGRAGFYVTMWVPPALALVCAFGLVVRHSDHFFMAVPILAFWLAAPWIAWWVSQPREPPPPDLNPAQQMFLRRAAREAWRYFETFVTAGENWLPPDNVQEVPQLTIAPRTSPTNLGLTLLANLAAYDFAYLTLAGLIERTGNTLGTMSRMERYRGHFYNWYETRTLRPLPPLYVSSVDSGNLAGHLLTLAAGLRGLAHEGMDPHQSLAGLVDTVRAAEGGDSADAAWAGVQAELDARPEGRRACFGSLERVAEVAGALAESASPAPGGLQLWVQLLRTQCAAQRAETLRLAPWLTLAPPAAPGPLPEDPDQSGLTASLRRALAKLDGPHTLHELSGFDLSLGPLIDAATAPGADEGRKLGTEWRRYLTELGRCLREGSEHARSSLRDLEALASESEKLAAMDFTFLFDKARNLFAIGFNVADRRRDPSLYDLLASEARLCSYVAIALGQVRQDHWFSLGRQLVASHGDPILVSWSGSMFEYLMPMLVMPNYENTLLDQTCRGAVQQQIHYGDLRGVPWGVSESGYNRTDAHLNYQYRAFGVPGMGLKRGLAEDLVIAPYAAALALMVRPLQACRNLERLAAEGRTGAYGFYEAVDYTRSRLPPGDTCATVRSFMVHHQGMTLLSLVNVLRGSPMQRRFMACPLFQAADLLLQERVPKTAVGAFGDELAPDASRAISGDGDNGMRISVNPAPAAPEVHLLSNGRYHLAITSAGGGYSRWRDLSLTRWREDATRDCWGTFVYLADLETGRFWSATHQPVLRPVDGFEAVFTQARAEFRHTHAGVDVHTEVCVSPEDDVELRRINLTNRSSGSRVIELTSYAEVVLAGAAEDSAHPAFSNLFVHTEFVPGSSAILCTRRARSTQEAPPWLVHVMVAEGGVQGGASCETDRGRFVGRGGDLANPAALQSRGALSNTVGAVLDPIISLRRTVTVPPHGTVVIDLVVGVAETRERVLALVEKYQSGKMVDRAFDLAWTHSQVTLQHLNATEAEAQLYGRLAGALIYADPARRANAGVLLANRRGQNGLWSYGVSGDSPIVLLRISDVEKIDLVRQLIQGHSYWRMKGLTVDLVILNEDVSGYRQSLQEAITNLISSGIEAQMLDKPGGIFVRRLEQVPNEDLVLLQAAARIVLDDEKGTLAEQLEHRNVLEPVIPALPLGRSAAADAGQSLPRGDLAFFNGHGGFTPDGREYVITVESGRPPPAPWVNVIANPFFGTVTSESGAAYTWLENSHEFRLTPWSDDPVLDSTGEAIYIRDEDTGEFWSPTPRPAPGAAPYIVRHGFGYTVFEHNERGIASVLWVYVAADAPVKFMQLRLKNTSGRARRLSVTGYWEWVLGDLRGKTLLHVQTELDLKTGALLARNRYNTEFPDRIAFLDVNDDTRTFSGDRKEFIGRNGGLARPAALRRARLSGRVGAGLDPCGALQVTFDLLPGQERDVTFRLGVGRGLGDVQNLVRRFRRTDAPSAALEGARGYWRQTLGAVTVETPDAAANFLANGWLLYQTLSCRLWGRTGFYQSGGAYGFRDQLQDVMALVHAEPALTREHLLRAASRQFREGDVQHWWHPPAGRGVRTHFSDDYLWLPYATCRYVACVADTGVLDEMVPFLESRPLKPEEEACYDLPGRAEGSAPLYQHCVRAIEHGLRFGVHGLPLMGGGDWNDGMNMVGKAGRGESVWLAFFLYDVLMQFSSLARSRRDLGFADRCVTQARALQQNIEEHAWDGRWYLRAYFDNGDPLGSQSNPECQIDSLSQSWAVLSGAGNPRRCAQSMEAVEARLIHREAGLIQLFDPPFDYSAMNPGYVRGYMPGVRENGGQYTHAAVWTVMAFALRGEVDRAWELFGLLNPIHHGGTPESIAVYKVEPYVVAADIYGVAPHTGRGGWTWYTGSAGWMYRLLIETLLGVNLEGDKLRLAPRLPKHWTAYTIHYRYRQTTYHLAMTQIQSDSARPIEIILDGKPLPGATIPLVDDRRDHSAQVISWAAGTESTAASPGDGGGRAQGLPGSPFNNPGKV